MPSSETSWCVTSPTTTPSARARGDDGHPPRAARRTRPRSCCSTSTSQGADAFELLRAMGADTDLRAVPVVTLSSHGDFSTFERAHRLGAAEFVTKPFSPDDLEVKIASVVSGRKMRSAGRLKLGAMLVASGLVTQMQVDSALKRQRSDGGRLGELLVSDGLLSEQDIVSAVAGQMRIGVVDLAHVRAPDQRHRPAAARLHHPAPRHPAEHRRERQPGPRHDQPARRHHHRRGRHAHQEAHRAGHLHGDGLRRGRLAVLQRARQAQGRARRGGRRRAPRFEDIDASIIEIVDSLLTDAATMDASDIHLEPREDSLRVRCRIDGVLHDLREFPTELQAGIISRLKIMGNLNIAERRLPQDGRTSFELSSGEAVDLRLATIPSLYGENVTIRILEVSALPPTLASLGLEGDNLDALREGAQGPRGRHRHRRPHGLGQVDHALHHAGAHQVAGAQDLHGRGPRRAQDRRGHPDRDQAFHRPHVRAGAALAGARRPRRHHGRRDPRPRDRQDGGRLRHHRPPRLQHAAHQRRLGRRQPARRDGRTARTWWRRRGAASWRSAWCAASARPAASSRP